MGRIKKPVAYRVTADIRPAGDFGGASIGGMHHQPDEARRLAERLADSIRTHSRDLLPSMDRTRGVHVHTEHEDVCEHCGAEWTVAEHACNECCPAEWLAHAEDALCEAGADVRLFIDGDQIAVCGPDFVDLQASDVIAWIPLTDATAPASGAQTVGEPMQA